MKTYFCWRCGKDMPFLEEDEWEKISPLLGDAVQAIKDYTVVTRSAQVGRTLGL